MNHLVSLGLFVMCASAAATGCGAFVRPEAASRDVSMDQGRDAVPDAPTSAGRDVAITPSEDVTAIDSRPLEDVRTPLPDVPSIVDAGPNDRSSATSYVELVLGVTGTPYSDNNVTFGMLQVAFGLGANRAIDRVAGLAGGPCIAELVENCLVTTCPIDPGPLRSAGEISATNNRLRITIPNAISGRYNMAGAGNSPFGLTEFTRFAATGSESVPAWSADVPLPGFADFTELPPTTIRRTEPLIFSFGPRSRSAGRRAVSLHGSGRSLFCTFEAGAIARVSPSALTRFPLGTQVAISNAALSEVVVRAGSEIVLVSTLMLSTTRLMAMVR